jgi:hypothetical protein
VDKDDGPELIGERVERDGLADLPVADGWHVVDQEGFAFFSRPPPRHYGWRDQVKVDARSWKSALGWPLVCGLLAFALVEKQWLMAATASVAIFIFARSFVWLVRLSRDGIVSIVRPATMTRHPYMAAYLVTLQEADRARIGAGPKTAMMWTPALPPPPVARLEMLVVASPGYTICLAIRRRSDAGA